MQSPKVKPKKRLTHQEKGKRRMLKYGNDEGTSNSPMNNDGGPQELRSNSANRALK